VKLTASHRGDASTHLAVDGARMDLDGQSDWGVQSDKSGP